MIATLGILWLFSTPLTTEGLSRWLERSYQRQSAAAVLGRCSAPVAHVVVLGTGRPCKLNRSPGDLRLLPFMLLSRWLRRP